MLHAPGAAVLLAALFIFAAVAGSTADGEQAATITIPQSFVLSPEAKAEGTGGTLASQPGSIQLVRLDRGTFLSLPAPGNVGNRLVSLNDPASGVVFRNNTLLAPAGDRTFPAWLVVTTDGLPGEPDGFFGQVTGASITTGGVEVRSGGERFSATVTLFLNDLLPGSAYEMAVEAGTGARGEPLTVTVQPARPEHGAEVSFLILSLEADGAWVNRSGAENVLVYRSDNGSRTVVPCRQLLNGTNGPAYQVITSETGTFTLAAVTRGQAAPGTGDMADLGGGVALAAALIGLLGVLAFMVRRVLKS